jgi:hypothetical protein
MKYAVFPALKDLRVDFRDLLPKIDKKKFKEPFIPAKIWKDLGDRFEYRRWTRVLKKYRVFLSIRKKTLNHSDITAEAYPCNLYIYVYLNENRRIDLLDELKYDLLQYIMHEMIHINQFYSHEFQYDRIVKKHENEYEDYLGKFGEIQAYAHHCFLDFCKNQKWGTGETWNSYQKTSPKVKEELVRQINRWEKKYKNNIAFA